jgi:hypothetical protein
MIRRGLLQKQKRIPRCFPGSALNCRPTVSERITGNHRHGVQGKFKVASQKAQGMTGVFVIAETLLVIPRVSPKSRSGMGLFVLFGLVCSMHVRDAADQHHDAQQRPSPRRFSLPRVSQLSLLGRDICGRQSFWPLARIACRRHWCHLPRPSDDVAPFAFAANVLGT